MVGILGLHSEEKRSKNRLSIVKLQEKSASGSPLPQDRLPLNYVDLGRWAFSQCSSLRPGRSCHRSVLCSS
jgi:hypothetical protein